MKLARLVEERRDEKLPIVPLPSEREMERRELLSIYGREVKDRAREINRLHSIFVKKGITTVAKKNLSTGEGRRKAVQALRGQMLEDAEYLMQHLDLNEKRIRELKGRIKREAKADEDMQLLQTIPGVGPVVAYGFVAHVGDGSRFSKGAQVGNYLGFVPRLDYSGTVQREGHITKRGNGYLRGLLVQAAWAAVCSGRKGTLKERFVYLTAVQGKSKKKTIVSIGRRMAELMYSVLRNRKKYEARPWMGPGNEPARLVKQAMSA